MLLARRTFLTRGASLLAAPAVIRVARLMPVRAPRLVQIEPFAVKSAQEIVEDWRTAYAAACGVPERMLRGPKTPEELKGWTEYMAVIFGYIQ